MPRKPLQSVARFRRRKSPGSPTATLPGAGGWKENCIIIGWIGTPVLLMAFLFCLISRIKWRNSLDSQLSRWKVAYHLKDSVVSQLRQIELEFHGSGNPITTPIHHSPLEIEKHHAGMATLMDKNDASKFLLDYASGH